METVILVIHLILAAGLVGIVLLQRSEGGGLAMSAGGSMAGRPPTTPLQKVTWAFAIAFFATSIALTIIAARKAAEESVLERVGTPAPAEAPAEAPAPALPKDVVLPPAATDKPVLPPTAS